jgi:hypothetical protein
MAPFFKTAAGQPAFSTEARVSDYEPGFAIGPGEPTALFITAKFWQLRANYSRPSVNSALGYNSQTAFFDDDTGFTDLTGGVMEWTRRWATVPASWNDYESFSTQFPGIDSLTIAARDPFARTITSKLMWDYFLVGSGGIYGAPDEIPRIANNMPEFNYVTDDTTPTATVYSGYRTADAAAATSYSLIAEDSILQRHAGNIWGRVSRRVKAL